MIFTVFSFSFINVGSKREKKKKKKKKRKTKAFIRFYQRKFFPKDILLKNSNQFSAIITFVNIKLIL